MTSGPICSTGANKAMIKISFIHGFLNFLYPKFRSVNTRLLIYNWLVSLVVSYNFSSIHDKIHQAVTGPICSSTRSIISLLLFHLSLNLVHQLPNFLETFYPFIFQRMREMLGFYLPVSLLPSLVLLLLVELLSLIIINKSSYELRK